MTRACVLLALLLAGPGCTYYVITSGTDLGKIHTPADARAAFGEPVAVGEVDGRPYEEFFTRKKIAEHWKGTYLAMGWCATFGLGELIWFPHQAFVAARRSAEGQTLRFVYTPDGAVAGVLLDGEHVPGLRSPPDPPARPSQPPEPAPAGGLLPR